MLAFVLGGGGSRGALQVGALEVLLEAGYQPDMLIGSSVGAVNAAFLASDPTLDGVYRIKEICLDVRSEEVYLGHRSTLLWNIIRGRESLFENENWYQLLQNLLPVERFSDLQLPCYTVATDVDTGEMRVFGDDPTDLLLDGLMSSTAVVPIHPPWRVNAHRYIDGAYTAVLPIRQAMERGATEIIALNLNQLMSADELHSPVQLLTNSMEILLNSQIAANLEYVRMFPHVRLKMIELQCKTYVPTTDTSRTVELIAVGRDMAEASLLDESWLHAPHATKESLFHEQNRYFNCESFRGQEFKHTIRRSGT